MQSGYVAVSIDYLSYQGHRLAWKLEFNEEPEEIDHINRDRADNRLCNLRAVDHSTNCHNSNPKVGKTLPMGVNRDKKKYSARLMVEGVYHYLGTYDTPEEAEEAYLDAKVSLTEQS